MGEAGLMAFSDYWVLDVKGAKGTGTVTLRVEQVDGTLEYRLKDGTLELPNGDEFDLISGRKAGEAPPVPAPNRRRK
jgi:hypothetical protein